MRGTYRTMTTTTISPEYKEWLNKRGIKYSTALALGVKTMIDREEGGSNREKMMEENISKLQNRLQNALDRIRELEIENEQFKNRIQELEEQKNYFGGSNAKQTSG